MENLKRCKKVSKPNNNNNNNAQQEEEVRRNRYVT